MRNALAILLASVLACVGAQQVAELVLSWDEDSSLAYRLFWQCNSNAPQSCVLTNGQQIVMTNYGTFTFWIVSEHDGNTSPPSNRIMVTVREPINLTAPSIRIESFKTNRVTYD